MLKSGILNPHINSLIARVRHTNLLLIADRGFPFYPGVEIVDISLVDGVPSVLQVFEAIKPVFDIEKIHMAQEYLAENDAAQQAKLTRLAAGIPLTFEPHVELKKKVPAVIGIIRTGDTVQYANMILVSGRV